MRISDWSSDVCSSDLKQHNPRAGLVQMHRTLNDRVLDFIEQDQITQLIHSKPGLTFNPDGSLSQTPANVAAMGRHYFDRPPPPTRNPDSDRSASASTGTWPAIRGRPRTTPTTTAPGPGSGSSPPRIRPACATRAPRRGSSPTWPASA